MMEKPAHPSTLKKQTGVSRRTYKSSHEKVVYYVGTEDGPVKIGITNNMQHRLAALNNVSPVKLSCLAAFPGWTLEERLVHDRHRAARLNGEWFERTPEIESEIRYHRGFVRKIL
jgi:hypothetical protein